MDSRQSNIIDEGARLRLILKDKGIKVIDFAKMADFSNQNAHNYLNKPDIKREKIEWFCKLINITIDQFYNWNDELKVGPPETHHGKRLVALIEQKGLNKTMLAGRVKLSRRALYNMFEKETLTEEQIRKVVPGLEMTVSEFLNPNSTYDPGVEMALVHTWRDKYYESLEDYKKLTQQQEAFRQRVEQELAALRLENEQLRSRLGLFQQELDTQKPRA